MKFKNLVKTHGKIALTTVIVSIFAVVSAYSYGNTHGKNEGEIVGMNTVTDKVQRDYNKAQDKIDELYIENSNLQSEKDAIEKAASEKKNDKKINKSNTKKKKSSSNSSRRPSNKSNKSSGSSNSPSIPNKLKDGVYEGSSSGYSGDVRVKVTVSGGKIASIQVSHTETPEYYAKAKAVIDRILSAQNTQVDSISGATITSNAIKSAVSNALANARDTSKDSASTANTTEINNLKLKNKELEGRSKQFEEKIKKLNEELQTTASAGIGELKDGSYEATSIGYNVSKPIKVKVEVKNKKISNVEILDHGEDKEYYKDFSPFLGKFLGRTDVKVDNISGATLSSNGIKSAITKALRKASGSGSDDDKADEASQLAIQNLNEQLKLIGDEKKALDDKINELNSKITEKDKEIAKLQNKKLYKDGTFSAEGTGYGNKHKPQKISLDIVIKDEKLVDIKNIKITKITHPDDETYLSELIDNHGFVGLLIRELNNPGDEKSKVKPDDVSGSTGSSIAIREAVSKAMEKSKQAAQNQDPNPQGQDNSSDTGKSKKDDSGKTDDKDLYYKTMIDRLKEEVESLKKKCEELTSKLTEKDKKIEEQDKQLKEKDEKIKYLEKQLQSKAK